MKKYTRWIPVHYYYFDSRNYMVFARFKSNGLLYFKTKIISGPMYSQMNIELNFMGQVQLLYDLELTEIF